MTERANAVAALLHTHGIATTVVDTFETLVDIAEVVAFDAYLFDSGLAQCVTLQDVCNKVEVLKMSIRNRSSTYADNVVVILPCSEVYGRQLMEDLSTHKKDIKTVSDSALLDNDAGELGPEILKAVVQLCPSRMSTPLRMSDSSWVQAIRTPVLAAARLRENEGEAERAKHIRFAMDPLVEATVELVSLVVKTQFVALRQPLVPVVKILAVSVGSVVAEVRDFNNAGSLVVKVSEKERIQAETRNFAALFGLAGNAILRLRNNGNVLFESKVGKFAATVYEPAGPLRTLGSKIYDLGFLRDNIGIVKVTLDSFFRILDDK